LNHAAKVTSNAMAALTRESANRELSFTSAEFLGRKRVLAAVSAASICSKVSVVFITRSCQLSSETKYAYETAPDSMFTPLENP
jgi:hypothetical protein